MKPPVIDQSAPKEPRKVLPPVSGKGKMVSGRYQPENHEYYEDLIGQHPMDLELFLLTAAGHPRRSSRDAIKAMGDEGPEKLAFKAIRQYCLTCAENEAEVRRCPIIDCAGWIYRMGRNPHNPRRGKNPFK